MAAAKESGNNSNDHQARRTNLRPSTTLGSEGTRPATFIVATPSYEDGSRVKTNVAISRWLTAPPGWRRTCSVSPSVAGVCDR